MTPQNKPIFSGIFQKETTVEQTWLGLASTLWNAASIVILQAEDSCEENQNCVFLQKDTLPSFPFYLCSISSSLHNTLQLCY